MVEEIAGKEELIELSAYLSRFVTVERLKKMEKILQWRTRYLTIALEDIFQSHNASAVLRSCEGLGIQDVHIIENTNAYKVSKDIALGADQWLTLYRYNRKDNLNSQRAVDFLRSEGYRLVATVPPSGNTCLLDNFSLEKGKVALFIGTELNGLSETILKEADEFLTIPMYGFTESFNLSVSAAIILHHLSMKLRRQNIAWELTEEEKLRIKILWLMTSVSHGELLVKQFLKERRK